MPIANEGAKK